MRISNNPPLHLSNHEVLTHLLHQKAENDLLQSLIKSRTARTAKTARALYPLKEDEHKEFDDSAILVEENTQREDEAERRGTSSDLIWIQDNTIEYLCADYNHTPRQTSEGIAQLADQLQDYQLTKAEILQIINLATTKAVQLYCVVEEVYTRFQPDPQAVLDEIGGKVASTLLPEPPFHLLPFLPKSDINTITNNLEGEGNAAGFINEEEYAMGMVNEEDFIHEAEWGKDKEDGIGEERENDME